MADKPKKDVKSKKDDKICGAITPGPAAYKLPPLVGYPGHDFTKTRGAAFSMAPRTSVPGGKFGPGPIYDINHHTRFGKITSPAHPFGVKRDPPAPLNVPGPGHYNPSLLDKTRAPAYTMRGKPRDGHKDTVPGPEYNIPGTLGRDDPRIIAAPTPYLFGKPRDPKPAKSPGPADYSPVKLETVYHHVPGTTMGMRCEIKDRGKKPGPNAYFPTLSHKLRAPKYTFGFKRDPCRGVFFTEQDQDNK